MCDGNFLAKLVLMVLITLIFLLVLAINYISTAALQFARQIGIFETYNTTLQWSQRDTFQNITITPAGWTFTIWGGIYIYQALLIGFWWSALFRRAFPEGPRLCSDPDLAPFGALVWHFFSSVCNIGWIVLADRVDYNRPLLIPLSCLLFGIMVCLYLALFFSYWGLHHEKKRLVSCNRRLDYWLVVGLVQNGMSMYATWCTIASFLNLDIALVFYGDLNEQACSIGCLAAVIGIVVTYAIADLTVLDPVTRFVFTPHLVVAWACAGSLARNFVAWSVTSVMTIVLVSLVVLALIVKFIAICIRSRSKPILNGSTYQLKDKQPL